jgi:EAL domain-containing protein (putative c-di-GMP-specific phosphodiesterase class I)
MNFDEFLKGNGLSVYLEPVVSIRQKALVGREARLAGNGGRAGAALRALAAKEGLSVDLDRWYRREALDAFKGTGRAGLLFLSFDTAVLDQGVAGSGHLAKMVKESGLDPAGIVIGIRESEVRDIAALKDFVARHRGQGFLIALKDIGEGHSNLERLALARPDILRVGDSLLAGLEKDFISQEIMKSLATLSRKIGALLVAEGVSTENQALAALDHGVDMLQGPFFGPGEADLAAAIEALALRHKTFSIERSKAAKKKVRETEDLLTTLARSLAGTEPARADEILSRLIQEQASIECLFTLNAAGIQESETHTRPGVAFKRSALFHPARPGADHSMKEYVYLLTDAFVNRYRTEPYVSLASGNLCVTLSSLYRDNANNTHILCVDVPWG